MTGNAAIIEIKRSVKMYQPSQRVVTNDHLSNGHVGADVLI